jgi:hypothetical protein
MGGHADSLASNADRVGRSASPCLCESTFGAGDPWHSGADGGSGALRLDRSSHGSAWDAGAGNSRDLIAGGGPLRGPELACVGGAFPAQAGRCRRRGVGSSARPRHSRSRVGPGPRGRAAPVGRRRVRIGGVTTSSPSWRRCSPAGLSISGFRPSRSHLRAGGPSSVRPPRHSRPSDSPAARHADRGIGVSRLDGRGSVHRAGHARL